MIQPETDHTENESIKRSDTEFLCKKIDCGDEDVTDWPEVLEQCQLGQRMVRIMHP